METTKRIKTETTKSGLPALWENGGSCSNTGECTIIAGKDGLPKKAIYIRKSGHLANKSHALIGVGVGDLVIKTYHKRRDFWHRIYQIKGFENGWAISELIYEFSKGQWNEPLPEYLKAAVSAATEKATTYHCRSPFYIIEPRI